MPLTENGFRRAGNAVRSVDSGRASTPLTAAASMATAAAASPWPSSFWATSPPKEWPITIGFVARPRTIPA